MERYGDRYEAGIVLADKLKTYANKSDVIVLALPRGGVPVGYEIANALSVPLDVFIVRKLGVPGQEELAMGAIASGGITVFNEDIVKELHISKSAIDRVIQAETEELSRREITYRGKRSFPDLTNKTVILVDDGIATGATMRAAIKAIKMKKPAHIILAVPVAANSTCAEMEKSVEKLICPLQPQFFNAVGAWYDNFTQTTDEEVFELLSKSKKFLK